VNRIIEISDSGRAPKNDPASFALALVAAHGNTETKALASRTSAMSAVSDAPVPLRGVLNALRGWGRGLRNAVGRWYVSRELMTWRTRR